MRRIANRRNILRRKVSRAVFSFEDCRLVVELLSPTNCNAISSDLCRVSGSVKPIASLHTADKVSYRLKCDGVNTH